MQVALIWCTVFATLAGGHLTVTGDQSLGNSSNVKESLIKMAMNDVRNPAMHSANNSFLNQFLDEHSVVKINLVYNNFDLSIDDRYEFQPSIAKAPFSSVGEPWPMPKVYSASKTKLLAMDTATFKITTLDDACDILTNAIKRYMIIISKHTIEEHYESVFNFDEKLYRHYKATALKYDNARRLLDLDVTVTGLECGFPNEDMDESYNLTIQHGISKLVAHQVWGALRGLETFSQLLFQRMNTQQIYVKETVVQDAPRFAHRGILIDTSRHFIHKYAIKNVLDGMAYNKMNILHWHIVDDNSFPYQSQVFPKLSEKGAYHPHLVYTLKDIREIVQYARLHGIRIIPEFDTPGHTFSWFGYPEIKSTCFLGNVPIPGPLGPINPAKAETYMFLAKLFSEISEVFPDQSIHLGGDELHNICWLTNPNIKAYLEEHANISKIEALHNPKECIDKAVGYYFKRLITTLQSVADRKKHTNYIMWEDVLKNTKEIPLDSIMQVWMGSSMNVLEINRLGYRALFSSCWYLDNIQRNPMWMDYYICEPSPYMTDEEERGKLLGGEACLWAEYITTDTLMTMMWPRASAPAERLWSPRNIVDLTNAMSRLQEQRCRMIYRGLPTSHISGPDYCLRSQDGPLNGIQYDIDTPQRMHFSEKEDVRASSKLTFIMLPQYDQVNTTSLTVPVVNIVLSLIGLYVMLRIIRCIQRRKLY